MQCCGMSSYIYKLINSCSLPSPGFSLFPRQKENHRETTTTTIIDTTPTNQSLQDFARVHENQTILEGLTDWYDYSYYCFY